MVETRYALCYSEKGYDLWQQKSPWFKMKRHYIFCTIFICNVDPHKISLKEQSSLNRC